MSDLDVRCFTVGPIQENAYLVRASKDAERAVLIDPGEEAERLLSATEDLGAAVEAILITHCHFDHIGAVAPLARATGAPVYCPQIEAPVLADIMSWVPPGFGPFESWQAEHTLAGSEHLDLAGLQFEVIFTPGHSPGHITYALPEQRAIFSGDVLFQGSVGRVDLPGGDWPTLERSIGHLVSTLDRQSTVYPGHMGITTLAAELQSNPFLVDLRASLAGTTGQDSATS